MNLFQKAVRPIIVNNGAGPTLRDVERAEFHVRRFRMALAQCTKGEERKRELRANLEYWQNVVQAKGAK